MAGIPQTGAALGVELRRDDPNLALSGSAIAKLGKGMLAGPAGTAADGEQAVLSFFIAGRQQVPALLDRSGEAPGWVGVRLFVALRVREEP